MAQDSNVTHSAVWRTPTTILIAGCISMMLAFGFRNSFSVFYDPMLSGLTWGPRAPEILGLSLAIQNLVWGLSQPIAGMIADRYGSGRVIAASAVIYAVGLAGSAMIFSPLASHMVVGVLIGIGLGGTSNAIILAVVGRSVSDKNRTLVMGIATAAASGGQFLIVPLAAQLLTVFDWRAILWLFAAACALIVLVTPLLSGKPAQGQGGQGQGGQGQGGPRGTEQLEQTVAQALNEAFRYGGYLYLVAGFFVCGFHVTFIGTHLPKYLVEQGFSIQVGGWAIALIGFANIFGAIYAGVLGGTLNKAWLLSGIYFGRAVVIALFILLPQSITTVFAFALAMGLLWLSTVPLTAALVGQMFGLRHMSLLFGLVFLSHQVGSFLGAWLGGRFFAETGSYDLAWWISIALGLFAALIHLPIRSQPVPRLQPA